MSVFERLYNLDLLGDDGLSLSKVLTLSLTLALLDSPFAERESLDFVFRFIVFLLRKNLYSIAL